MLRRALWLHSYTCWRQLLANLLSRVVMYSEGWSVTPFRSGYPPNCENNVDYGMWWAAATANPRPELKRHYCASNSVLNIILFYSSYIVHVEDITEKEYKKKLLKLNSQEHTKPSSSHSTTKSAAMIAAETLRTAPREPIVKQELTKLFGRASKSRESFSPSAVVHQAPPKKKRKDQGLHLSLGEVQEIF